MNLDWRVRRLTDLVDAITARAGDERSGDGRPVIVGINGHSSSGKTTLAGRLRDALPGSDVLHTDDLAWHQGVFGWGGLLIDDVLPVVRSGAPVDYRPPQWVARGRDGSIRLSGGLAYLILEGVGASMPSVSRELDLVIWVETDEPTRSARDVARVLAGENSPSGFQHWMTEENAYVTAGQPWLDAQVIVNGGDSIPHDRVHDVVLAGADLVDLPRLVS